MPKVPMKPHLLPIFLLGLLLHSASVIWAEPGFQSLFDGRSFSGWKKAAENPDTWSILDGALVARGPRCHLFYVGDEQPFKNFHLKLEIMTRPGSNGGVIFHTAYQAEGWPLKGFESQVNINHKDWRKSGSIIGAADIGITTLRDNEWWTHEIIVEDNQVRVLINGKLILMYNQPEGALPGDRFDRILTDGTFALQGHDPHSEVHYRNIRVKRLDD